MSKNFLYLFFIMFISSFLVVGCLNNKFSGKSLTDNDKRSGDNLQYDDDDDDDTNSEERTGSDLYDPDGDGIISQDEFDEATSSDDSGNSDNKDENEGSEGSGDEGVETSDEMVRLYGPISAKVHRVESDCLAGKCSAKVTLKLYKLGSKTVSSSVSEASTVHINFSKAGAEITGSEFVCPTQNVVARYNMSIEYGGKNVASTDRSILIGARDPENKNHMYIGLADVKEPNYAFHNIDTVIGSVMCPEAKRIVIKDLCRDQVLEKEDSRLIRCWMTEGRDSSCPKKNIYSTKKDYPAQCKVES